MYGFSAYLTTIILTVFLCLLFAVRKSKWIAKEIRLNWAIRNLNLPCARGDLFFGLFSVLLRQRFSGDNISPNVHVRQYCLALGHLFKDYPAFRMDGGLLKQGVLIHKAKEAAALLGNYQQVTKAFIYDLAEPWLGNSFLIRTGPKWKKQRKLFTPAFHSKMLEGYQEIMSEQSRILLQQTRLRLLTEEEGLESLIAHCALDIVMESAMGVKAGTQVGGSSQFIEALNSMLKEGTQRITSPWMWPTFIFRLTSTGRQFFRALKIVRAFVSEVLPLRHKCIEQEIKASCGKPIDFQANMRRPFIDAMLLHNANCPIGEKLTDKEIEDEIHGFAFAGYDTVTVSTYWVIYHIGLYPEVRRKLYEEMDEIFGDDTERLITMDDLKHMTYLDRVIKESQRQIPIGIALIREIEDDLILGDVTVPAGTTVGVLVDSLHMDEKIFPNPEVFDPDRFLKKEINPFAFVPFSAGPRGCLGQRYAVLEMKTMIADLLRNFEWTSLETPDKVLIATDVVPKSFSPLKMKFTERRNKKQWKY